MILGAGVFLFGGLTKLGLDLTNQKTRRVSPSQPRKAVTPLVIEGMQMPAEDGWTYHPPSAR
jgi:hypothetical protein